MTVGTGTFKGLAAPLNGEFELKQVDGTVDHVTITGTSAATGRLLVIRAGETEVFSVSASGGVQGAAGLTIPAGKFLKFSAPISTAPITTGLSLGQMFLVMKSTTPQLGVAINASTTATVVKYFTANTATFGRASTT